MEARGGFSLIEVLVALAVLGIAGLALMQAQQENVRASRIVEERALATLAAENLLNTQLLDGAMSDRDGRYELAGIAYDWSYEVERTSSPDLVRLRLEIRPAGQDGVLIELTTFRRAAR
jgi:general secretion pathway protein I